MKIPKYIDEALRTRTELANKLDLVCYVVDKWLDENHIDCESCDTHTGVEIYCNPQESEKRVREAIEKARSK